MIRTVADLLREIVDDQLRALDSSDVTHAPTVGEMYEGLSGELLSKGVPSNLGLQVVKGFVTDGHRLSGQIDRMLVHGEGEHIPQTSSYKWHVRDVIAVVETKKRMLTREMGDALAQLLTVKEVEQSWFREDARLNGNAPIDPRHALRAFAETTGKIAPIPPDLDRLSTPERMVYSTLMSEQFSIVRIAYGLHGFSTETGMRRGLLRVLRSNIGQMGFGPGGLPQLIISGGFALVKANGQPYSAPMKDDGWPFLFSTPVNPLLIMLELIWTRLDRLFGLGNPWGMDLEGEVARPLILGIGTSAGWNMTYVDPRAEDLREAPSTERWNPSFLTEEQFTVMNELCMGLRVRLTDGSLLDYLTTREVTLESVRDGILDTRLVALNGDEFELITENCVTAILRNGEMVAADNNTGRLTRWLGEHGQI